MKTKKIIEDLIEGADYIYNGDERDMTKGKVYKIEKVTQDYIELCDDYAVDGESNHQFSRHEYPDFELTDTEKLKLFGEAEKIKLFYQYIGQRVLVTNADYVDGSYIGVIMSVCQVKGVLVEHPAGSDGYERIESCTLILKELKSISHDDKNSVLDILETGANDKWWIVQSFEKNEWSHKTLNSVFAYQLLQSKGYALPQHNYSIDELIRKGWIFIKN